MTLDAHQAEEQAKQKRQKEQNEKKMKRKKESTGRMIMARSEPKALKKIEKKVELSEKEQSMIQFMGPEFNEQFKEAFGAVQGYKYEFK